MFRLLKEVHSSLARLRVDQETWQATSVHRKGVLVQGALRTRLVVVVDGVRGPEEHHLLLLELFQLDFLPCNVFGFER